MKLKLAFGITASALLTLSSCSNSGEDSGILGMQTEPGAEMIEVTGHIKQEDVKVAPMKDADKPVAVVGTRTTFDDTFLTDQILKFRWSAGDKVYLHNGESSEADFSKSDTKKSFATFKFTKAAITGKSNVPVQYVGTVSTTYGKANIASTQEQSTPSNADHIGKSGDCAVSTINRNSQGNYTFTLHHKAAFLCFMPYSAKGTYKKLYSVTVSADKPLSKEYDLSSTGLEAATTVTEAQPNYVYLKTGGTNGFVVGTSKNPGQNASIMVVHPQKTALVCVFTVGDNTGKVMNVVKYIPEQDLKENTLHPFTINLDNDYGRWEDHLYYMWDAKKDYWFGYETAQPTENGQQSSAYPQSSADSDRWYREHASTGAYTAKNTMTKSQAAYDTRYLVQNPFSFDALVYWPMKGALQHGGMWITRYSKTTWNALPTISHSSGSTALERYDDTLGRPKNNIGNFFFLPAMGYYSQGKLEQAGSFGGFWMYNGSDATDIPGYESRAYFLSFRISQQGGVDKSYMIMGRNQGRNLGLPLLHSYYSKEY